MNKYAAFVFNLLAHCLLLALSASCATRTAREMAAPTATAAVSTSVHTPTPILAPSYTPTPTSNRRHTLHPTSTAPPPTARALLEHVVQPDDTLLGLAKQYGVPMAAIQLQNGMGDSDIVWVGETLSIPPKAGWQSNLDLEEVSPFWVVHVVKEGETLISIARAYDLEARTIQATNGLIDADLLGIGQELVLPLEAPAVAHAPPPTATPIPPTATSAPATVPPVTSDPPTAAVAPAPVDVAAWPRETARLINKVRAQHGLGPLTYDETLARAAQAHANDCAQRGWCSHTGSDGAVIKTRILRAGYDPASWAECWAQRKTPQGAVDIWMDEVPPNDPHRRTLLTTWLSEIGIGVAKADWGYYFIADFGRP